MESLLWFMGGVFCGLFILYLIFNLAIAAAIGRGLGW